MPFLDLPNELILEIAEPPPNLVRNTKDLYSLIRTNRRLATLLTPMLHRLAAAPENRICALLWAAAMRNEQMVRQLVARGAGYVTLLRAREERMPPKPARSNEDIVRLVLEKGANLIVTTKGPVYTGWEAPAFLYATHFGYKNLAMLLLENGADMTWTDQYGRNLLHMMSTNHTVSEKVIREMIEYGADVSKKTNLNSGERTPLYEAAQFANATVVKVLLENGADTMARNSAEHHVFHAVLRGVQGDNLTTLFGPEYWDGTRRNETIRILLRDGSIAFKDNCGNTGLHRAAFSDDYGLAEVLLRRGVEADARGYQKRTALHWAASFGSIMVIQLLLENGAEVNVRDIQGKTPLHLAVKSGFAKAVAILIGAGADINAQDKIGRTPLHLATRFKHTGIFRLLLWKGVDLAIPDGRCRTTALHSAAKWGDETMVKMLLRKGADFTVRNKNGETPLLLAAKYGHIVVVKILYENGADITAKDHRERGAPGWVAEEVLMHPERCIMEIPNISMVNRLRREKDKGFSYKMARDFYEAMGI